MTSEDDLVIRRFLHERQAVDGVSLTRSDRMDCDLVMCLRFLSVSYQAATWDDVITGINRLRDTGGYSKNTYRFLVANLKMFLEWLSKNGLSQIPLDKIDSIKLPKLDRMTRTADDLLSPQEVADMVTACQNSRDRALVAVLFESACRGIELATLTWRQIKFDEFGAVMNTDEKTGAPRFIRLIASAPYLSRWKTDHPKPTPESLVFTSFKHKGEGISHSGLYSHLKRIAKRAGLADKKIGPHLFRHSRVTSLIRDGYNSEIIKKMCWGRTDTAMFATYLHLVNADTDTEMLEKSGLVKPSDRKIEDPMGPRQCPHCMKISGPTDAFCPACGHSLSTDAQATEGDVLSMLRDLATKDPQGLIDALRGLGMRELSNNSQA
ncbi:MAG: tyrosine-type recombinase/integrase [Methanomicrobiales archaeon]|nr:tyrosine-type recombinase/integrase [Methanomicrobiales archaeon]